MRIRRVRHRANECALVHVPGDLRQQLADLNAGDVGRNDAVGSANIDRGGRLGVERFQMARSAVEPDQDAGQVPFRARTAGQRLEAEQVGEAQAQT